MFKMIRAAFVGGAILVLSPVAAYADCMQNCIGPCGGQCVAWYGDKGELLDACVSGCMSACQNMCKPNTEIG